MVSLPAPSADPFAIPQHLPRLLADWPGLGGVFKHMPEDFVVEELPAYLPSGAGDHLFLWVQKRGIAGPAMVAALAQALAIRADDIGMAGVKDMQAVTRQWLSVPVACQPRLDGACQASLAALGIEVLAKQQHTNKLRTGHLRGNRFSIRLRDVDRQQAQQLPQMLEKLRQQGLPNFFGAQRFGWQASNVSRGLSWLRGKNKGPPRGAQRRFLLSAVQSALFNTYLAERLASGTLGQVLDGDVMQVVASGGPFVAEDIATEQRRYQNGDIVPTGPMFGSKMRSAQGAAGAQEQALLQRAGLTAQTFAIAGKLALGTRRALVVKPDELAADLDDVHDHVMLTVVLPPGSYATVLLAEIMGHTEDSVLPAP